MFRDRRDAGRQLALRLARLKGAQPPVVVLGLPRGGIVVASEIARELGAPLDVLVVRKIGAPNQPELAIGAVTDGEHPQTVLNQDLLAMAGVDDAYVRNESAIQLAEVKRRQFQYRLGRPAVPIEGRCVVVVDDGIATGATAKAALMALRQSNVSRLLLAVPVAPQEALKELEPLVDQIECLSSPPNFVAVGRYYDDFNQVSDAEVMAILQQQG
jgi:putative phosphoribosyl transferase